MELIVIGESRLKIMLTGEDMARYDLAEPDPTGQNTDSVTPHTREVLRHIFADAHSEIGFDTEGERLFVQLYASKGGGCEIFVTKLGDTGETRLMRLLSSRAEAEGERVRRVRVRVETLTDLTALCRRLAAGGYRGRSGLYITEEKPERWFLTLTLPEPRGDVPCFPFLSEYGDEIGGDPELYLAEHGRMICREGAVEMLAKI